MAFIDYLKISMKTRNAFSRIIQVYVDQEKEWKKSNPTLGDAAYDALMKKTKGRVIDTFLTTKVVSLSIDKLVMTHRGAFYSIEDMMWKIDDHEPVNVIKHKGKFLLLDGHHRLLIHKITGQKKIKARLVDLDRKKRK